MSVGSEFVAIVGHSCNIVASYGTDCRKSSARQPSRLPEQFTISFKTELMLSQVPGAAYFQTAALHKKQA